MQANPRDRAVLGESLRASRRAMARDFLAGLIPVLGQSDLSVVQLASLIILDDGAERTVKEMAEQLGRSVSATSRLLDQLVRRRLIRRWEDPDDRRARRVGIAETGRSFLSTVMDRRAEAQLQLMEHLTLGEREQVMRGMALLSEAARRSNNHER